MKDLDPISQAPHIGTEVEAKKKHDYKFLGSSRKPFKNAILYAYDKDKDHVYAVKITAKEVFNVVEDKDTPLFKAHINPNHTLIWALNETNAERKFKKYVR